MAAHVEWDLHYDRRVSDDFLQHFVAGGVASSLVEYVQHAPYPLDLQMRKDPKRKSAEHATLYVGLTAVLNVRRKGELLLLDADKKYMEGKYGFSKTWTIAMTASDLHDKWRGVEDYLEAIIPTATIAHASREGAVQAAASVFTSEDRIMIDREVALHFRDTDTRDGIFARLNAEFAPAIQGIAGVPGVPPTSFGGECDLLAVDPDGRLLAVEVKPRGAGSITWSPVQATVYAELLRMWVNAAPHGTDSPSSVVQGMLHQRFRLGLAGERSRPVPEKPAVVPVVAVQRGANPVYVDRMNKVQDALERAGWGDPPLEIYEVSIAGRMVRLR